MTEIAEQVEPLEERIAQEEPQVSVSTQQRLIKEIVALLNEASTEDALDAIIMVFPKCIEAGVSSINFKQLVTLDTNIKEIFFKSMEFIHLQKKSVILRQNLLEDLKREALEQIAKEAVQEAINQEPQVEPEVSVEQSLSPE